jgi:nitric oxide reductase NorQ protein
MDFDDIKTVLSTSSDLKPKDIVISDLKWKYVLRGILRHENMLIVGPTGSGKTLLAKVASKALNRLDKFFYFNLGSTQDARSSLIGNTHFKKETGTVFNESSFVRALRTKNAVILLDEISRAHPDAWNILMTVLDETQRYLRLDEKEDVEIINVADGVSFISTANVGSEYTSTRVMDKALINRFPIIIEMSYMESDEEFRYLSEKFNITDKNSLELLQQLVDLAADTRLQVKRDDAKLSDCIGTRTVSKMAELIVDGFSFLEIVEVVVYPMFSSDGGVESERTYIKQLIQKRISPNSKIPNNPFKPISKNTPGGKNIVNTTINAAPDPTVNVPF